MTGHDIKLYYFDFNGRAEVSRLILHYAGKPFKDIRYSQEKWPEYKPLAPFGQGPFAEIDGKFYGQSLALAQFFARENNLYGKTNLDALKIDQFSQLTEDLIQEVVKTFREQDPAKKAEIVKNIKEVAVPKYVGHVKKLLEENGGKNLVGNGDTLADIVFYDVATGFLSEYTKEALANCSSLTAVVNKIGDNKGIKAYTQSQKK